MVDICLAGTGGMMPLPARSLSCLWIWFEGHGALIDCGEGTQVALERCGCKLSRLELIMITHVHGDHILGLPGLLLTMSNLGKSSPLTICGPKGLMQAINGICSICPMLPYPVDVYEFDEKLDHLSWHGFTVDILPLRHTLPCLGYRLTLNRPAVFDPVLAEKNGVPQEYWQRLHRGESVAVGERVYTQADVAGAPRKPIIISYTTDTVCFDEIADFAKNADLMVCEGMYGDMEKADKMMVRGHMVFLQAASLAKKANAKRLWLTHYSPALKNPKDFEASAKAIFPNTLTPVDGERITL